MKQIIKSIFTITAIGALFFATVFILNRLFEATSPNELAAYSIAFAVLYAVHAVFLVKAIFLKD